MSGDAGQVARSYRIADTLTLRAVGAAPLLAPFDRFYGAMRTASSQPVDLEVRLSGMRRPEHALCFEQSYNGGRWWIGGESMSEDRLRLDVAADRLGRVMVAQAGAGSVLRYMLGRRGLAWLHAAALVRSDEALVLAGPSGVGKSQLVLRAIGRGWRYVTDDHALVSDAGLSGLTTPILLRGYGGWPGGLSRPAGVRFKRLLARVAHGLSLGKTDPMVGVRLPGDAVVVSPLPRPYRTTVCLLERGSLVKVKQQPADILVDTLDEQMRHAGRFLDAMHAGCLSGESPLDLAAFWKQQRAILQRWLQGCRSFVATLPSVIDEANCQSLLALTGLAKTGGRRG